MVEQGLDQWQVAELGAGWVVEQVVEGLARLGYGRECPNTERDQ